MFFFKQKTAYEMRISDWSSDVCSSDLRARAEKRALKSSATGTHQRTHTACGRREVLPSIQPRGSRAASLSKWTTWQRACTPASVRPAQTVSTGASATADSASSSICCPVATALVPGLPSRCTQNRPDRNCVVEGMSVYVRVDPADRLLLHIEEKHSDS